MVLHGDHESVPADSPAPIPSACSRARKRAGRSVWTLLCEYLRTDDPPYNDCPVHLNTVVSFANGSHGALAHFPYWGGFLASVDVSSDWKL